MQTWFEVGRSTSRPMLAQKGVASLGPQPGEHAKVERRRVTCFPFEFWFGYLTWIIKTSGLFTT